MSAEIVEVVVLTTSKVNYYLRAGYCLITAIGMTVEAKRSDTGEPYIAYAPRFILGRPAGVERYVPPPRENPETVAPTPGSHNQMKKRWAERGKAHAANAGRDGHAQDFYTCAACWGGSTLCGTCVHPLETHGPSGCVAQLMKSGQCPCEVAIEAEALAAVTS